MKCLHDTQTPEVLGQVYKVTSSGGKGAMMFRLPKAKRPAYAHEKIKKPMLSTEWLRELKEK